MPPFLLGRSSLVLADSPPHMSTLSSIDGTKFGSKKARSYPVVYLWPLVEQDCRCQCNALALHLKSIAITQQRYRVNSTTLQPVHSSYDDGSMKWPSLSIDFSISLFFHKRFFADVNLSLNSAVRNIATYIYALQIIVLSVVVYCRTPNELA